MTKKALDIVYEFLHFSGNRTADDFYKFIKRVREELELSINDDEAFYKLHFILKKLQEGYKVANHYKDFGSIYVMIEDSEQTLEDYYQKKVNPTKKRNDSKNDLQGIKRIEPNRKVTVPKKVNKKKTKKGLGKITDEGERPHDGRADRYWEGKLKVVFTPDNTKIRKGEKIPNTYKYDEWEFLKSHYGLKAIEFGNWLSQQDRKNYVAGLGLALYDFSKAIGFSPKQLSLNGKIILAFGARGRGGALAHFEPKTFAINMTRYSRPQKGDHKKTPNNKLKYILTDGGIGAYAHEFGHALDFYGGMYLSKSFEKSLSGGKITSTKFNSASMNRKEANSLNALMDNVLTAIIFNKDGKYSAYYQRLKDDQNLTDYYYYRAELFARAFESYVHLKLFRKKWFNTFLAETKYNPDIYLTPSETKTIEPLMDKLLAGIKAQLK